MATVRWRTLLGVVNAGLLSVGLVSGAALTAPELARANDSAAHSIADKFAHDSDGAPADTAEKDRRALERKVDDEARLKADEAEMLERAKAEAADIETRKDLADRERAADEARRAAEEKRLTDEQAAQDRAAKETAAHEAREAETRRHAAEQADAERRAAEAQASEQQAAEDKRRAEEDLAEDKAARERAAKEAARIKNAEAERLAADKADVDRREREAAEAARVQNERQADAQRRMEADREEEARRLSEKLTRAREQRGAKEQSEGYSALGNPPAPGPAPAGETDAAPPSREAAVPQPAARAADDIALAAPGETRATILLVMEPGTRGIRRYEKTADPILCIGARCFIGNGIEAAATVMTRGRALGPGNTLGQRAGACRHSLVCIFRDVDVGAGRFDIQPIDMRILRHDRREKTTVESDRTCTAAAGHLHCSRGAQTASYRAWIVPESVARKAGASALSAAISSGLTAAATANLER